MLINAAMYNEQRSLYLLAHFPPITNGKSPWAASFLYESLACIAQLKYGMKEICRLYKSLHLLVTYNQLLYCDKNIDSLFYMMQYLV